MIDFLREIVYALVYALNFTGGFIISILIVAFVAGTLHYNKYQNNISKSKEEKDIASAALSSYFRYFAITLFCIATLAYLTGYEGLLHFMFTHLIPKDCC